MAKTFRHLITDGWICIDNNTGTESRYPYSWWLTQEPAYVYPSGAYYVMYTEGGVSGQSYYQKNNNQYLLPIDPWPAGNSYIARQGAYDAAYASFLSTPATAAQAKSIKFSELLAELDQNRRGGVIYGGNTYPSDIVSYQQLFSELNHAITLTAVPVGYYVKDITGTHQSLNLVDLTALVDGIEKLHYEGRLNYDTHFEAITALGNTPGDIGTIMAYNVTTGWPAVPFTP